MCIEIGCFSRICVLFFFGMYNFYALGEAYTAMQEQQPGPTPSNHAAKWRKERP